MMNLKTAIFSILVFLSVQGNTQTIQIDSVQACVGDTISMPIKMTTLDSLGAITLYIGYDTTMMDFIHLTNIHPLASSTMFNDVHAFAGGPRLGKIAISWVTSGPAVNFNAGIFAVLKFKVLSGNTQVSFLNNCEIADYQAQIININYLNGNLTVPTIPLIAAQPSELTIHTSQNGYFTINASSTDNFQWQIKTGNNWVNIQNNNTFQGIDKDTLLVSHPDHTLDGIYFRCTLSNACLTTHSDSAKLNVTGLSVNENDLSVASIYPNPFNDHFSVDFSRSVFIETINIIRIDGKCIQQIEINKQTMQLFISQLKIFDKGMYFIEIVSKNKDGIHDIYTYKMIKN